MEGLNRMLIDRQGLHHDLADELHTASEATEILRLLKLRDGVESIDAWRTELEAAYWSGGRGADQDECADRLRLHAQHIRASLGLDPVTWNTPRHKAIWRYLHRSIKDLVEVSGVGEAREASRRIRARIAARFGVQSTTHLPPTLLGLGARQELLAVLLLWRNGDEARLRLALTGSPTPSPPAPVEAVDAGGGEDTQGPLPPASAMRRGKPAWTVRSLCDHVRRNLITGNALRRRLKLGRYDKKRGVHLLGKHEAMRLVRALREHKERYGTKAPPNPNGVWRARQASDHPDWIAARSGWSPG